MGHLSADGSCCGACSGRSQEERWRLQRARDPHRASPPLFHWPWPLCRSLFNAPGSKEDVSAFHFSDDAFAQRERGESRSCGWRPRAGCRSHAKRVSAAAALRGGGLHARGYVAIYQAHSLGTALPARAPGRARKQPRVAGLGYSTVRARATIGTVGHDRCAAPALSSLRTSELRLSTIRPTHATARPLSDAWAPEASGQRSVTSAPPRRPLSAPASCPARASPRAARAAASSLHQRVGER